MNGRLFLSVNGMQLDNAQDETGQESSEPPLASKNGDRANTSAADGLPVVVRLAQEEGRTETLPGVETRGRVERCEDVGGLRCWTCHAAEPCVANLEPM